MAVKFNPFTGNLDLIDTTAAAGSDTQVQFNSSGSLTGSADLTWDDTGKVLGVGGDVDLDDGGTYTTTLQTITATANRTISFPNATGTVALVAGSSGQLIYNLAGANAGASTLTYDGSILTTSGRFINSYNATASSPAKAFTGTWFTGGTATTTKPQVLIEPTGTTSTAWSTSGTGLGINAASGFAGNLLDLQVNGTSACTVSGSTYRLKLTNSNIVYERNSDAANIFIINPFNSLVYSWTTFSGGGQGITFSSTGGYGPSATPVNTFNFRGPLEINTTTGTSNLLNVTQTFKPSTGNGNIVGIGIYPTINQSGTATGNYTGLLVNITETSFLGSAGLLADLQVGGVSSFSVSRTGTTTLKDAANLVFGTTTGTKIGTSTTQKLGFYNATPVIQPTAVADITTTATSGSLPTPDGTVTIADATTPTVTELLEYCVELEAKLEAALGHLRTLGLIAT